MYRGYNNMLWGLPLPQSIHSSTYTFLSFSLPPPLRVPPRLANRFDAGQQLATTQAEAARRADSLEASLRDMGGRLKIAEEQVCCCPWWCRLLSWRLGGNTVLNFDACEAAAKEGRRKGRGVFFF